MRKVFWAAIVLWSVTLAGSFVIAQVPIPFEYWPALYGASENMVCKQGLNRDGSANDHVYCRVGWDECLAIEPAEISQFIASLATDRYTNVRDYADQQYSTDWDSNDGYNCPIAPLEVKPYWRGSRPVYYRIQADGLWIKGSKSPYRILSPSPSVATCEPYNAHQVDGDETSYWRLSPEAVVYDANGSYRADSIAEQLTTVCREQDIPVEDYRW